MSIASEITRLQGCKANIRTALVNKGITSASTHNMADFATDISNISAGGATITVTYSSSFYNKTMTCTKGSTTYTQTTTSSGSTVFNVTDEGTWTITCNGISRTVYVTLNYSTQMAVTKTITVYGAVGATISFTDAVGSKTVTLNSSGQGSVSITFIPPSQSITFTDTNKAKNPNNLSQNYSKSITITESTTSVKVMPDNALYWWGYESTNIQDVSTANGWSHIYTLDAPTHNTNNISCNSAGTSHLCAIGSATSISAFSKIKVIAKKTSGNANTAVVLVYPSKTLGGGGGYSYIVPFSNTSNALVEVTASSVTSGYIMCQGNDGGGATFSAVWYE